MYPTPHHDGPTASPARYFARWMAARWKIYAFGGSALVLTNLTELALPKIIQLFIDSLRSPAPAGALSLFPILIVFTLVVQYLGRIGWRSTLARESAHAGSMLKLELWSHTRLLPLRRFLRELTPGAVMSLAASDVSTARLVFGWTLVGVIDCIVMSVVGLALLAWLDASLALAAVACLAVLPFFMKRLSVREYQRHSRAQESLSLLNERCAQAASALRLQRLTGTEQLWERRSLDVAAAYRSRRLDVVRTAFQFAMLDGLVHAAALGLVLLVGVWRYTSGYLSLGEFVAAQSYIILLQSALGEIGVVVSEWQRGMASLSRVISILGDPPDAAFAREGKAPERHAGHPALVLERLVLQGADGEALPQGEISIIVRPGERVGVQGRVGSGKTVLLETIAGLRTQLGGSIYVFGEDSARLPPAELHKLVTIVPQHPFIFADTVRANVALEAGAMDEEIWRWLEIAGLKDEIAALPGGLGAPLGEWGINLSGGQRQRLTLARALAARPKILLLDDCLSAVDAVSEARIFEGLARELAETAVLWAGHRPSALAYCDRVLRFDRERAPAPGSERGEAGV